MTTLRNRRLAGPGVALPAVPLAGGGLAHPAAAANSPEARPTSTPAPVEAFTEGTQVAVRRTEALGRAG